MITTGIGITTTITTKQSFVVSKHGAPTKLGRLPAR